MLLCSVLNALQADFFIFIFMFLLVLFFLYWGSILKGVDELSRTMLSYFYAYSVTFPCSSNLWVWWTEASSLVFWLCIYWCICLANLVFCNTGSNNCSDSEGESSTAQILVPEYGGLWCLGLWTVLAVVQMLRASTGTELSLSLLHSTAAEVNPQVSYYTCSRPQGPFDLFYWEAERTSDP